MTDEEIGKVAARILRQDASRHGFIGADAISDVDFFGDPVIRLTARYKSMPRPARPLDGVQDVRSELLRLGEPRIVLLTNKYDDEVVENEEDAA